MNKVLDSERYNPVVLAQELIRCPSITPQEGGALSFLESWLRPLGFVCHRLRFSEAGTADVENLYARLGSSGPNFCFAGHSDVVPPGPLDMWTFDPFSGTLHDGFLHGRGAVDMKGALAAFVAAVYRLDRKYGKAFPGSLSFLITGDEESIAINGTRKVLAWLKDHGESIDAAVVGEPSCPNRLGDMIKIGRRGSLNAVLEVEGVQGHTAYPQRAANPIHAILPALKDLIDLRLDDGTMYFEPSRLQITSIDVGNSVFNVIPGRVRITFNVRFNDAHSGVSLTKLLNETLERQETLKQSGLFRYSLKTETSANAFLSEPGRLSGVIADAVREITGLTPEHSTTGGTSDARFIHQYCPVVEFGLVNTTIHKVNERVAVDDLEKLTEIYKRSVENYFGLAA